MRVMMLGWEFPPVISGGLGTACQGLTDGLSRLGVKVLFVLPRPAEPGELEDAAAQRRAAAEPARREGQAGLGAQPVNVQLRAVPARLRSPYAAAGATRRRGWSASGWSAAGESVLGEIDDQPYAGDLIAEAERYAQLCLEVAQREMFDVVHAHDWLTFPAAAAVAAATAVPFVAHIHSTEYDRSGQHIHPRIYQIERRGLHQADRIIAVSHLTRKMLQHRYGVDPEKIEVIYNGIDTRRRLLPIPERVTIGKGDKIVLFLGRITLQKGPEYFVHAAKKVLEKIENVKFVMAGSGDMVAEVIELAAAQGIGHKVLFTGFLRGGDVERVFQMADVYVMPSVSEPFGIAPLEAISHDVPVIISRTSGVSEVIRHALKVDFWDVQDIADKIIAVLRHHPLSSTLRRHAEIEVRRLTWDDTATGCVRLYQRVLQEWGIVVEA